MIILEQLESSDWETQLWILFTSGETIPKILSVMKAQILKRFHVLIKRLIDTDDDWENITFLRCKYSVTVEKITVFQDTIPIEVYEITVEALDNDDSVAIKSLYKNTVKNEIDVNLSNPAKPYNRYKVYGELYQAVKASAGHLAEILCQDSELNLYKTIHRQIFPDGSFKNRLQWNDLT